ncbi:hypothetical protein TGAM01_v209889 [Trichoderma gamsii]|uniref:Chromatin modification-related protein n=1 Tax=Trichoderma gamsii TaxID=398673 RepID=A0A2K0T6T8_9HYPO|nr:hypothetical protein TGAM01_v209889 [Trichoderma gamsii]PNP41234.1 hypothetical protein TGAMA5MH_07104 [Trichoderma gamsii]PON21298.1 hypothetical protein TGAM01_v209889 [Trichoderma gamsii]
MSAMKSAKAPAVEASSHRRSQPVRQTRTNPPRSSATTVRPGGRDSLSGPAGDQPIDVFPAITHFADTITALPKELVRHFTLLKEVDAKIFAPQEQLFRLVASARTFPVPEARTSNDTLNTAAPGFAPMSAQGGSNGIAFGQHQQPVASTEDVNGGVFDPSNLQRRQLFRQTAFKIQELLVSLEEKNHVISTANEALQRQLARVEDVWPYLENEFSDEAKWGSTTHWAYPENRNGKPSQAERSRRDGAAAISAAAQALAEQAAARSDARKQAVQAKKSQKTHALDSEADDHDSQTKISSAKKTSSSKVRKTAESNNVGLGISTGASSNSNPPQKRRKVDKDKDKEKEKEKEREKDKDKDREKDKDKEKEKTAASGAEAPQMERAMSLVFGNNTSKTRTTTSPRETPAPEVPKKRKALPTSSGQSKKKNVLSATMSPSAASSPVMGTLPETKTPASRPSPVPTPAPAPVPRPTTSRARQNSIASNSEASKARPPSSAAKKTNGNMPSTPEIVQTTNWARPNHDSEGNKEPIVTVKTEPSPKEPEQMEDKPAPAPTTAVVITSSSSRRNSRVEEADRKSEPTQSTPQSTGMVTTKSGRASKPSTPALPSFSDAAAAAARPRATRNVEPAGNGKKSQKKGSTQALAQLMDEDGNSSMQGDDGDDDADIDPDEATYCYCNSISYGAMVACDSDDCAREWFHLACVGLKVAPSSKTKWYCPDCKERLKVGSKKNGSR